MTRPMPGPPEDCYCRFGNATCQECETRGYPYSWGLCPGCELHNGRDLGAYKRLKDAECAAEYWRARSDSWAYELLHLGDWFGWSDDAEVVTDPSRDEVSRWDDVAHRFATRPHALAES